jgi:hypothetical protein
MRGSGMKRHLLLMTAVIILQDGCKEITVPPPGDPSFRISGAVIDSKTSAGIESVTVGWKNPSVPDNMLFSADSLLPYSRYTDALTTSTLPDGSFILYSYPDIRDTSRYKYLFAFKPAYRLWRFNRQLDQVTQVDESNDHCDIVLTPK